MPPVARRPADRDETDVEAQSGGELSGVTVAVLTYRRADQLARLLPALLAQVRGLAEPGRVLVVDNDPAASARELVTGYGDGLLRYVHEPRPGIAGARNRALAEAAGSAALVFVDDDELPDEQWLATLVARWRQWGCAAVAGPVLSAFSTAPPAWVAASGSFDRPRRPTGTVLPGTRTGNLLLDLDVLSRTGVRFDERLGLTGGEDTVFSRRLVAAGGTIRWCDEAVVVEAVPPERVSRRWVLRRAFRTGTSWSHMELAMASGRAARLRVRVSLVARGLARAAVAAVAIVAGVVGRDLGRRARGEREAAACAGLVGGAVGYRVHEYGRPDAVTPAA